MQTVAASQVSAEVPINENFTSLVPGECFAKKPTTSSGLTWGYVGGRIQVDGVITVIADGTVTLTASTTNYVQATRAGVVSTNTTSFTAGSIPIATVVTGASTVTSYTDERGSDRVSYVTADVSTAITTADVTLTAAQARCRHVTTTGVLTGNRNLVLPNNGEWIVFCNNTGAFTTTFKTSGGSGIVVAQGKRALLYADGTNVVRVTADV